MLCNKSNLMPPLSSPNLLGKWFPTYCESGLTGTTECWVPSQCFCFRAGWAWEFVCCWYGDHTVRTTAPGLSSNFPYCLPSISTLTPKLVLLCPLSFPSIPIPLTSVFSLEGRGHRGACLVPWQDGLCYLFFSDSLIFKYVLNSCFHTSQLLWSCGKVNLRHS